MTEAGDPSPPARADRLKVALLTREYPPEVASQSAIAPTTAPWEWNARHLRRPYRQSR